MQTQPPVELLTRQQVAKLLSCSLRTVDGMRSAGTGPQFVCIGVAVRYPRSEIDAWIKSRLVRSTAARDASKAA